MVQVLKALNILSNRATARCAQAWDWSVAQISSYADSVDKEVWSGKQCLKTCFVVFWACCRVVGGSLRSFWVKRSIDFKANMKWFCLMNQSTELAHCWNTFAFE